MTKLEDVRGFKRAKWGQLLISNKYREEFLQSITSGMTFSVPAPPANKGVSPGWVPHMDPLLDEKDMVCSKVSINDSIFNEGDYFFPILCYKGWQFSPEWLNMKEWDQFVEKIKAKEHPPVKRSESGELMVRDDFREEFQRSIPHGTLFEIPTAPADRHEGPGWEEEMDYLVDLPNKKCSKAHIRDYSVEEGYFIPRIKMVDDWGLEWTLSVNWIKMKEWDQFLARITGTEVEDTSKESHGLGALFGALALAAGVAVIKSSKEKKLVSKARKEKSYQVKETQEFVK